MCKSRNIPYSGTWIHTQHSQHLLHFTCYIVNIVYTSPATLNNNNKKRNNRNIQCAYLLATLTRLLSPSWKLKWKFYVMFMCSICRLQWILSVIPDFWFLITTPDTNNENNPYLYIFNKLIQHCNRTASTLLWQQSLYSVTHPPTVHSTMSQLKQIAPRLSSKQHSSVRW